ncbi:hypothetical protein SAMN05216337_1002341 [Bradyrhizobium brasilense]|uniref:Uncharacterized protein n=2 Tax=Bradyrhizobium brasilense TaxID=1419277 RepID=A0A1G6L7Y3_9BRAD|nr:hypothetical protein SAMN05216337_1002341 [Bradyrhizobium brasilense]
MMRANDLLTPAEIAQARLTGQMINLSAIRADFLRQLARADASVRALDPGYFDSVFIALPGLRERIDPGNDPAAQVMFMERMVDVIGEMLKAPEQGLN